LVYGGHTIAVALAQASRALPDLLTVLGGHADTGEEKLVLDWRFVALWT
jgi:hypothetical protein